MVQFPVPSSFNVVLFTIFVFLGRASFVESEVDPQYEACVPKSCGNQTIKFPFWIQNQQESFCGYPRFDLTCHNNYTPIFQIQGNDIAVQKISYSNQTLHGYISSLLDSDTKPCLPVVTPSNISSDARVQVVSSNVSELLLFYDCSSLSPKQLIHYRINTCGTSEDSRGFALYRDDDKLSEAIKICDTSVSVPVESDGSTGNRNYGDDLRRGISLKWTASNCRVCEVSGGRCGFDTVNYIFRCFCTDRPHAAKCSPGSRSRQKRIAVIASVSAPVFLLLLGSCIYFLHTKRKRNKVDDFSMGDDASRESLKFDFRTISNATNNFSDANTLGKGGFGVVYRGLLPNGQEIAVKRLSKNSVQGDKEFQTEVMLVAKLQHRNLVRLLGFCLEKEESLLIYEFVANSSLDNFLFDTIKRSDLNWETRFKIIGGIARGILYLHEDSRLRIIHRDLKASNVLLDEEMNPKISDFGTARLFILDDETHGRTMRIVGTYGYMAPEYAMYGHFSVKSDVFSFGVLLLEIVSGQRNNCYQNGEHVEDLSSVAWISWKEGRAADVIDPALISSGGGGSIRDMIRCIHIGLLCVQENESRRPTMASVDVMLSSSSMTLQAPSEPAFFMHSRMSLEEPLKDGESISAGNMDPTCMPDD